jgi:hypothetical protein
MSPDVNRGNTTFKASIHRDEAGNWFFSRCGYDTGPYDSATELCEELGKLLDQFEISVAVRSTQVRD